MSDPLTNYLSGITTASPTVVTLDHSIESAIAKRLLASLPEHDQAVRALHASPSRDEFQEHIDFALDLGGPAGVVATFVQNLLPDHDGRVLAALPRLAATA